MALQKISTVGSLYGLRAGLSVISQEKDAIDSINNRVEQAREESLSAGFYYDSDYNVGLFGQWAYKSFVRAIRATVLCVIAVVVCIIAVSVFPGVKSRYLDSFDKMAYLCGLVLGVTFSIIVFFIVVCLIKGDCPDCFFYIIPIVGIIGGIATVGLFATYAIGKQGVIFCGLLFGLIVFAVLVAVFNFITLIINFSRSATYNSKKHKEIKEYNKRKIQNETRWAQAEAELEKVLTWKKQNLPPHIQKIECMYRLLKKSYAPMLDERDWENLDLIIYQLETRRADSIKEALQLIDRELQTRRLENMITGATNYIVETMKQGFSMLQNTLVQVYEGLSNQLSNIGSQLVTINNNIVSASQMNAALLAKANSTSEALVRDLHAIRSNSDYQTYLLKRNA